MVHRDRWPTKTAETPSVGPKTSYFPNACIFRGRILETTCIVIRKMWFHISVPISGRAISEGRKMTFDEIGAIFVIRDPDQGSEN